MIRTNDYGQPIGPALPDWTPPSLPPRAPMVGRYCRLELLDVARHAADLHAAYALEPDGRFWTYLPYGPFDSVEAYASYMAARGAGGDPLLHAIIDLATGKPVGVLALQRIDPANGVIEIGQVRFSPLLQKSRAGTEAHYLMMRRVFDELGYRRLEWKCDHLNAASRRTAERLGYTFEGTFRNAVVVRGRSRDSDWLSVIDSEWPVIRQSFDAWLAVENFDADGRHKSKLGDLIAAARSH